MTREQVIETLKNHEERWRGYGVTSLSLFGSVARGEGSPVSDVDILVDFETESFGTYFGLLNCLEELLGVRVDLVVPSALRPQIRGAVMAEAVRVA